MKVSRLVLVVLLSLVSSSCGYSLAGRGSFLPAYIRVVAIPPIENRTAFVRVEQVIVDKIRREYSHKPRIFL